MRRWFYRYKAYHTDMATLYSEEEDDIIFVHRRMAKSKSMANNDSYGTKQYFLYHNLHPMTLNWVLKNYLNTVNCHIPNETYKQILEDLAHAAH